MMNFLLGSGWKRLGNGWNCKEFGRLFLAVVFLSMICPTISTCHGFQEQSFLSNASFEEVDENQEPVSWRLMNQKSGTWKIDAKDTLDKNQSLQIIAKCKEDNQFTGIVQKIDGEIWQGKTLKLKAFVKTDGSEKVSAELWIRSDRKPGQMGAFKNMAGKLITSDEWDEYAIEIKIDDDAQSINAGLIVKGEGSVWVDGFWLEETEALPNSSLTKNANKAATSTEPKADESGFIPARSMYALGHLAPKQSFFSPWLVLVGFILLAFCVAQIPAGVPKRKDLIESSDLTKKLPAEKVSHSFLVKWAFRFSFCYWLLFSLPSPVATFIPYVGGYLYPYRSVMDNFLVLFMKENVFHISTPLVSTMGNGSGDTTYSYLRIFSIFSISATVGTVWSFVDLRKTDNAWLRDILYSFVRYSLALTMLGYGLAKVAWDVNQFNTLTEYSLNKTWSDCSPMGVLWKTMGYSRAYSVFGGAGEVLAAFLLIFRRTALIGAFVTIGVMTNVVMMNMCFDVPVKLYSTHYLVMGIFLVLPHTKRLMNLFVFNKPTEPISYLPSYTGPISVWFHRSFKAYAIIIAFMIPALSHSYRQVTYLNSDLRQYEGRYDVEYISPTDWFLRKHDHSSVCNWESVTFRKGYRMPAGIVSMMYLTTKDGTRESAQIINEDPSEVKLALEEKNKHLPKGTFLLKPSIEVAGDYILVYTVGEQTLTAKLTPAKSPLMDRGFRWVNETPFNR